eukprot:2543043-Amphidinium_carterae.1
MLRGIPLAYVYTPTWCNLCWQQVQPLRKRWQQTQISVPGTLLSCDNPPAASPALHCPGASGAAPAYSRPRATSCARATVHASTSFYTQVTPQKRNTSRMSRKPVPRIMRICPLIPSLLLPNSCIFSGEA